MKTKAKGIAAAIEAEVTRRTIRPEVEALEILFDRINTRFFNDELEMPVITVAPARRIGRDAMTLGHCTSWRAWRANEQAAAEAEESEDEEAADSADAAVIGAYELNISAEMLHKPLIFIAEIVTHEACHLLNVQRGIKDTSRGGTYHNKKFKATAEAHGLLCEADKKYGWNWTTPAPALESFIAEQEDIRLVLARAMPPLTIKKPSKKPYKYECPECGAKFQSSKPINAVCVDCTNATEVPILFKCTYDPVAAAIEEAAAAGDGE